MGALFPINALATHTHQITFLRIIIITKLQYD